MTWLIILLIILIALIIVIASFALPEFGEFAFNLGKGVFKWSIIFLIIITVFIFFYVSCEKQQREERERAELKQEQLKQERLKQEEQKRFEQERLEQGKKEAIQNQRNKAEADLQICTNNCRSKNRINSKITACLDKCIFDAYYLFPSMSEDESYYRKQGDYYYEKEDYNKATSNYYQAIRLNPNSEHSYAYRAMSYFKEGKYYYAILDTNEVLRISPNDAVAYSNRGSAYYKIGHKELACNDFNKACELGNCTHLEKARNANFCR